MNLNAVTRLRANLLPLTVVLAAIAVCAYAALVGVPVNPLAPADMTTVVAEIKEMIRTPPERVRSFAVRAATPDRIDRLYRSANLADLPRDVREYGLLFAGRGTSLFTFKQPSDILAKVVTWFPDEVAASRKDHNFYSHLQLRGPFSSWEAEPQAFMVLWDCMPMSAWLTPDQNPFRNNPDNAPTLLSINSSGSSDDEFDFGRCVNGFQKKFHLAVKPVLVEKLSHTLSAQGCTGRGPDDCVLLLRMWASLSPADADLAKASAMVEAALAPLPLAEGRARYDEGLRHAAFLRAKLLSVLNAPASWPPDALALTLRQMSKLRTDFASPFVKSSYTYELDYRNDPVNPWLVLDAIANPTPALRDAIGAELELVDRGRDCTLAEQWTKHGGKWLRNAHALARLHTHRVSSCVTPDFAILKERGAEARAARAAYLGALAGLTASERDMVLSGLTNDGDLCFDRKAQASMAWLREPCAAWISEPMIARTLPDAADKFTMQETADGMPPAARAVLDGMRHDGVEISRVRRWRQDNNPHLLYELSVNLDSGSRLFLVVDGNEASIATVPARFQYQYDEGEVTAVSDLDHDGKLEVWLSGSVGECNGDGPNCAAELIHMGELAGNSLTYFKRH